MAMSSVQDLHDIAGLVADIRGELDLEPEGLAAQLHLPAAEIDRIELGETDLNEDALQQLVILALHHHQQKLLQAHGLVVPPVDHQQPFWDNFRNGPRGVAEAIDRVVDYPVNLFGRQVGFPFGIPACALIPNSKFVRYFAQRGYDVLTYKTVRDQAWDPYPFPNWAFVPGLTQPILEEQANMAVVGEIDYWPLDRSHVSMVNSFGVPSLEPIEWQEDVERSKRFLRPDQLLIVSVMGRPEVAATPQELADQFARAASLAVDAGAHAVELNLSCPNTGSSSAGLVCQSPEMARLVVETVAKSLKRHGTPILIKISHLPRPDLEALVVACAPSVQGIVAINTVSVPANSRDGGPLFSGASRHRAGLSGIAIRNLGLDTVGHLVDLRRRGTYDYVVIGVGGVMSPRDYAAYREMGADIVQSCTGVWINPNLAAQIRKAAAEIRTSEQERREVITIPNLEHQPSSISLPNESSDREEKIMQEEKQHDLGGLVTALFAAREQQLTLLSRRSDFTPYHQEEIQHELSHVQREHMAWRQTREQHSGEK